MEATDVKTILEAKEAAVERQDLHERLFVPRRRCKKGDSVGSQQKLSAARKRLIHRAVPAWRKGDIRNGPGRDKIGRENPKVRTFGKKQRTSSDCNSGIKGLGAREET
jgi:hypothetical protein